MSKRAWIMRRKAEMSDPAIAAARAVAEHHNLQQHLDKLQELTGYAFRDRRLAVAALFSTNSSNRTARHLAAESKWTQHRLAWLGDSVLHLLATMQFAKDPVLGEADRQRQHLETNAFLCGRGQATGLVALAIASHTPSKQWPAATVVEAVVGAVFQDSGEDLQATRSALCALGILQ